MEGGNSGLSPYYHHRGGGGGGGGSSPSPAGNGMFSAPPSSATEGSPLIFPHPVSGRVSAAPAPVLTEPVKRKRGRPRKYGTLSSPSSISSPTSASVRNPSPSLPPSSPVSSARKKETSLKKAQLTALGNAGQGFIPHVITIASGEDVQQKIMSFTQQHKRAVCILSASGSISNASLRQPAMLGGNVAYEGRFEILSLTGSFLHVEIGGASSRTGGLSICLSGADGRIVGGGVGGPLLALGPVQVIAGSFLVDTDKDLTATANLDNSVNKLSMPVQPGTSLLASPFSFRSVAESAGRITASGSDDHQSVGGSGSSYLLQSSGMHVMPSRLPMDMDWGGGRRESEHGGACESPGDDDDEENIQD